MSVWSSGSTSLLAGLPWAGEGPAVGPAVGWECWLAGDTSFLLPATLAGETWLPVSPTLPR